MKRFLLSLAVLAAFMAGGANEAWGQYYALANQLTNVLRPALSGSLSYRGMVEVSGIAGTGYNRINTLELATVQGFKYGDWFFMGAGLGIDLAVGDDTEAPGAAHGISRYKAMMPIFSDFRFNFGGESKTSFFIDLRLGAAWFFGNSFIGTHHNYIDDGTYLYLKPGVGVRIPASAGDPTRAFNIALTYQLLTNSGSNGYYYRNSAVTMNGFGITLGYEW